MTDVEILTAKTVIVGASSVGKTCIAMRYFNDEFSETTPTLGSSFFEGSIKLSDKKIFKFEVWDTAGQENYMSLTPVFFKDATIAILVYDITKPETLEALEYYVQVLRETAPECVATVVGNKSDLESSRRIPYSDGQQYKEKINAKCFLETSAKTGSGITELFDALSQLDNLKFINKGLNTTPKSSNETNEAKNQCC